MTKQLLQIRQRKPTVQISWILNNICTNHCDYCPPSLHSGTNHHYQWDHAKTFTERLLARYTRMHVSISGGEPTLSPHFRELVDMFHSAGHTVGITSNGARSIDWWRETAPQLSYICFSYHPGYPDPQFEEKVLAAADYTQCTVRVMMDASNWSHSLEAFNKFRTHGNIRTEAVRLLPELANRRIPSCDYTPEQDRWLNETPPYDSVEQSYPLNPSHRHADIGSEFYWSDGSLDEYGDSNYLLNTNRTDFRGWSCNIGLESLFIFWDGDVKKGNCHQGGVLFNIRDHHLHPLPDRGELCFQPICHCGTDILITKVPVLAPDNPIIDQHSREQISMIKSQEEYVRQHRRYIKIEPQ